MKRRLASARHCNYVSVREGQKLAIKIKEHAKAVDTVKDIYNK